MGISVQHKLNVVLVLLHGDKELLGECSRLLVDVVLGKLVHVSGNRASIVVELLGHPLCVNCVVRLFHVQCLEQIPGEAFGLLLGWLLKVLEQVLVHLCSMARLEELVKDLLAFELGQLVRSLNWEVEN